MQSGSLDYKSTTKDVRKLIRELREEEVKGIIIDLRDNGGGSLQEANTLTGLFIGLGPTVQVRDADGHIDIIRDHDPKMVYSGPLVVLVNRLSASASEIFAGAIQDYNRGLVLGGQTFGKGTVQSLMPLSKGQLKATTAKYYRISGQSTQNKGVIPDLEYPDVFYDPFYSLIRNHYAYLISLLQQQPVMYKFLQYPSFVLSAVLGLQ